MASKKKWNRKASNKNDRNKEVQSNGWKLVFLLSESARNLSKGQNKYLHFMEAEQTNLMQWRRDLTRDYDGAQRERNGVELE
ncbi:UNVERIFIED_CONTAM: hypothetical protein K2H54_029367 [Gekko kuhli]